MESHIFLPDLLIEKGSLQQFACVGLNCNPPILHIPNSEYFFENSIMYIWRSRKSTVSQVLISFKLSVLKVLEIIQLKLIP
jgi:hypothetical protein